MNILIFIMLIFFGLGLIDCITGRHMGLADGFERGIAQTGSLCMSIVGIYCIGITVVRQNIESVAALFEKLPFDGSIITSMILAPDLGGYPLALEIAASPELIVFSGFLLSGGLGCLISFQLPIALVMIKKEHTNEMMQGFVPGIIAIPAGLLAGCLMLSMDIRLLLINMVPVLVVCLILAFGAVKFPKGIQKVLSAFGTGIRYLSMILSAVVLIGLFYEPWQLAPSDLVKEALVISVKIAVVVCGGLALSDFILNHCRGLIHTAALKLGINQFAMVGLVLSLTSGIAMLPLFEKMDHRGRLMNAAFSVMGAYVFGGQMAFVAGLTTTKNLLIYMAGKLISGILALVVVWLMDKTRKSAKGPVEECVHTK